MIDILGWLWWLVLAALSLSWGVVWFLLGGWVSTLAQIGVVAMLIFGYKYGWRRAPQEIAGRLAGLGRFVWGWARAREMQPPAPRSDHTVQRAPVSARRVRAREPGDVNLSTLLNLLMLGAVMAGLLV